SAERDEIRAGERRQQARERGLASSWRSPKDQRVKRAAVEGLAQRPPLAEEMLLADELVERPRPNSLGERRAGQRRVVRLEERGAGHARSGRAGFPRPASYSMSAAVTATLSELTPGRIGT